MDAEATISGPLLEFLRGEFGACRYAEPPAALVRGNETDVYSLRLDGLDAPLDRPLVLQDPRQRILETALGLFAEKGFDAVTLRAIGSRVGLHKSSLFHHFRSKAEIARAAFDRVLERVLPKLERLAEDDPPELERFIAVLPTLADHFADHPDEARFLTRAVIGPAQSFRPVTGRSESHRH